MSAVRDPGAGVEGGVVHFLAGLQVDDEHGCVAPLRYGQHHRRGQICGEEHDDEIAVGLAKFLRRNRSFGSVGYEPDINSFGFHGLEAVSNVSSRFFQLWKQFWKLGPVGSEPASYEAYSWAAVRPGRHDATQRGRTFPRLWVVYWS